METAALPPVAPSRVATELRPKMQQQAPTFSRDLLGSPVFSRVLLGSPVMFMVLQSSPGFSWVLHSSPGISSLLQGFSGFSSHVQGSPGFSSNQSRGPEDTGFSTGFFEVLLGCCWFSFIQSDGSQSRVVLGSVMKMMVMKMFLAFWSV